MGTSSNRSAGTQVTQRGITQGTTLVDPLSGYPVDVIQDEEGVYRLAVDADITADSIVVDTRDLAPNTDTISIGNKDNNGNTLAINSDGSINVNEVSSSPGIYVSTYNEVSSVASGILTTIITYTVPAGHTGLLQKVIVSGDNIATYAVQLNSDTQDQLRTYFGGNLNADFNFASTSESGLPLNSGDTISVNVIHNRPYIGDFNSRIQVIEN